MQQSVRNAVSQPERAPPYGTAAVLSSLMGGRTALGKVIASSEDVAELANHETLMVRSGHGAPNATQRTSPLAAGAQAERARGAATSVAGAAGASRQKTTADSALH